MKVNGPFPAWEHGSKFEPFKDKDGNITVKPKAGNGPGEPTGININDY